MVVGLIFFLQFLRWQVKKIDLESFLRLNAILQFKCRFRIWQVSWSLEKM